MKTGKILLTLLFLILSLTGNAQYVLKDAFPGLSPFSYPIELVHAYDGTNRIFVAQQFGVIYVMNNSTPVNTRKIFINLTGKVSQAGGEMGLLGLAFHPNFENNHYFYVNFTFDSAAAIWQRISRFSASVLNPDTSLVESESILMTVFHPHPYHCGGKAAFGSDGYLYISFGDGGSVGDIENRAQNKSQLLGKILRINIDSAYAGMNYSIPNTNPFFGNAQGYKEEIYAYGLRNVWKFSFDYQTNRLWAADVGNTSYEEIDIIENGNNYGWRCYEGNNPYNTSQCSTITSYTFPIWEYSHFFGDNSITGGYVYRGSLFPELYGKYLYGDFVSGRIWALSYNGIDSTTNTLLLDSSYFLSSFGIDQNNEFYICKYDALDGRIYTLSNPNVITLNIKAVIQGFYDTQNNRLNIRDTIRVYLHSVTSPNIIIDSSKIVIDSLTFRGLGFFNNAPTGSYYIRVNHRNALETWSKLGGEILSRGDVVTYDFTINSSQAFGNNLILKGGIYTIYSGDVTKDGFIDGSDLGLVDNAVFNLISGYVIADVNGDNFADASDLSILDNNVASYIMVIRP